MSAAAAPVKAGEAAPKKGKKKLIIILAAVLLLLMVAGGGAVFYLKKKAADEAAAEDDGGDGTAQVDRHAKKDKKKDEKKTPPAFVPLDPFVVNLADHDVDRFAQIGITLQVDDEKATEEIKTYLPAIRNNILLLLSRKTSQELAGADGKALLAREVLRAAVLPMGVELPDPDAAASQPAGDGKHKKHGDSLDDSPVKAVQFSSFIIQ